MTDNNTLDRYFEMLLAAGLPEREAARAVAYAQRYGLDALTPPDNGCVAFNTPTCGDWDCLSPEHQTLTL